MVLQPQMLNEQICPPLRSLKLLKFRRLRKKRRVAKTGVVMANALKRVAAIHNENIFTVLGNVASLDENSEITNILQCSTNVLFSKLHPKKAVNVILSQESLSALIS